MATQRKQYSAEFKARVALEALKGLKTAHGQDQSGHLHIENPPTSHACSGTDLAAYNSCLQ